MTWRPHPQGRGGSGSNRDQGRVPSGFEFPSGGWRRPWTSGHIELCQMRKGELPFREMVGKGHKIGISLVSKQCWKYITLGQAVCRVESNVIYQIIGLINASDLLSN